MPLLQFCCPLVVKLPPIVCMDNKQRSHMHFISTHWYFISLLSAYLQRVQKSYRLGLYHRPIAIAYVHGRRRHG